MTTNPTTTPVDPSTKPTPWAGFGYAPVRGLVDRHVARFLRTQRKTMRRFFQERGHLDLFAQLDDLRKNSARDFRSKNTTFQRILNEYISRANPVPVQTAAVDPIAEAASTIEARGVVVPAAGPVASSPDIDPQPSGDGADAISGVSEVAGAAGDGVVIEE